MSRANWACERRPYRTFPTSPRQRTVSGRITMKISLIVRCDHPRVLRTDCSQALAVDNSKELSAGA